MAKHKKRRVRRNPLPARKICSAYKKGHGLTTLAKRHRCGTATVRKLLTKHKCHIRRTGRPRAK